MKFIFLIVFFPFLTFAQTVDVENVGTEQESTTTIEVRKGKPLKTSDAVWEIHDGVADIEGDVAPLESEARGTWKKACDGWKKEFRDDNKENKIISMSCGSPTCAGETGRKTCTSKANYKIKTKMN